MKDQEQQGTQTKQGVIKDMETHEEFIERMEGASYEEQRQSLLDRYGE